MRDIGAAGDGGWRVVIMAVMRSLRALQATSHLRSGAAIGALVQRQCACGGAAEISGRCSQCEPERLLPHRTSNGRRYAPNRATAAPAPDLATVPAWDLGTISLNDRAIASRGPDRQPGTESLGAVGLQPRLKVGKADDPLEREAESLADQLLRIPDHPAASGFSELRNTTARPSISMKSAGGSANAGEPAPAIVQNVLASPGKPLDRDTRRFFEPRLGQGLGNVRIHDDSMAAASARAVSALAYTVGPHIVFDSGQYAPNTDFGRKLMSHELVHYLQQGAPVSAILAGLHASDRPTLRRYEHRACSDADLGAKIWPADGEARKMTANAISALKASPPTAAVTALFAKYFQTSTPNVAAILAVFQKVQDEFTANDYIYECEDDCDTGNLGYVYGFWSHIHLCMNNIRGWSTACIGRTMVHEFTHYYAGTDDKSYCKSGCGFSSCPPALSVADALANADSFACFAYELYSAPAPAPTPAPTAAPTPTPMPTTYTVVTDDYLEKIAMTFYGDPQQWPKIYNENTSVIGPDPNRIYPGQVLTIPP
jgi:hypothetical protein